MMWGSNSCMKYQLTPREIYLHKYAAVMINKITTYFLISILELGISKERMGNN